MTLTITLDEEVSDLLEKEAQRTGVPKDAVANEVLKRALETKPENPMFPAARPMKLRPGLSLDNIDALLDEIEGPSRR